MKSKIFCPVCRVNFMYRESVEEGKDLICPVCGAKLIVNWAEEEVVHVRKYPQTPEEEIRGRADTFAQLKGYTFNEDKEELIEGLLLKKEKYGDLYCPCRIENVPENICPCLRTRQNDVKKHGHCY